MTSTRLQYAEAVASFTRSAPMAKALLAAYRNVKEDAAAEPVKPGEAAAWLPDMETGHGHIIKFTNF
jgi:hypothetical protein